MSIYVSEFSTPDISRKIAFIKMYQLFVIEVILNSLARLIILKYFFMIYL